LAVAALVAGVNPVRAADVEFKDGDRVLLLGSTLIEREQRYGYWETALIAANPTKNITFRNLGWSGDTVWGEARAGFDTTAKGFERLVNLTLELKPTVILVNYGTNESFAGKAGLEKFENGLEKLLDALKPANAGIILFLPLPFESGTAAEHNPDLKQYAEVIRKVGVRRGLFVADIGAQIEQRRELTATPLPPLTDNGMHLTDLGYKFTADYILSSLGIRPWAGGPDAELRWRNLNTEPLRKAVTEKNQLFFHRWRPQNVTYLFGFRKAEQGNNAREIPEFDPLIAKKEKEIAKLRSSLGVRER
jgi:lysophospholipase L1-like esterase